MQVEIRPSAPVIPPATYDLLGLTSEQAYELRTLLYDRRIKPGNHLSEIYSKLTQALAATGVLV